MALAAILTGDQFSKLPEDSPLRTEYVEKDGNYVLQVAGTNGFELANTTNLRTALEKERGNVANIRQKLAEFKDIDPVVAAEALKRLEDLDNGDDDGDRKKADEAFKAREKQLVDAHTSEKGDWEKNKTNLLQQLEKNLIRSAATAAINAAEGSVELLLPHVLNQARMRQSENGDFSVEIVNKDGHARINGSDATPMSITQLIGEMRGQDVFAPAFKGTGNTGSGASGSELPPGTPGAPHVISEADAGDVQKYRAAKAAAEKAGVPLQLKG